MDTDQYPRSMTLFVWVAILCIAVTGFAIVGAAAEPTTSEIDTEQTFAVNITSVNTSVIEGDTLITEATISNQGAATDSQQIHLKNDDNEIVDSIADPPLTLAPGESENVTLTWETGPEDAMTGEVSVVSNHGKDSRGVQIEEGAFITIENATSNSPVSPGNTLYTTVNVTNTHNHTATRDVWLAVNNDIVAETTVELSSGQNRSLMIAWTTPTEYTGNLPLTIGTPGDQQTIGLTLVEPQPVENSSGQTADQSSLTSVEGRGSGATATTADASTTGDTNAYETTDDESPGFGAVTALISLLLASGLVAYRRV